MLRGGRRAQEEIEMAVLFLSFFFQVSGRQVKWAAGEWEWRRGERAREGG